MGWSGLEGDYAKHGWVRLPARVPAAVCDELREAFVREVLETRGTWRRILTSREETHRLDAWGRMLNPIAFPHRYPHCPEFSQCEVRVMRTAPLIRAAEGLLGGRVAMLQSAYWMSSEGISVHLDVHPVHPEAPMLGAWVALEDIAAEAGRFFIVEGSHALPDTDADVAALRLAAHQDWRARYVQEGDEAAASVAGLVGRLSDRYGLHQVVPEVERGEVLLWDARVAHGSEAPIPGSQTRHSVLMHFVRQESVVGLM